MGNEICILFDPKVGPAGCCNWTKGPFLFGVYLMSGIIYQLTQSQRLCCPVVEDEIFCLILLLSAKSNHHPIQIAINMSR